MPDKNQKMWQRAKNVIPGGNSFLSKRPDMFLPDAWPTYFKNAKGCLVVDLNDTKFLDMCVMGVGTNLLGYSHPEINSAVVDTVNSGNMSSLNAPEEVILAEKLVELHPWAEMVRFARTGGEANSIAVRIARAASGKPKVAVCGYHGWHDWYLSVNLGKKDALEEHLLPGLEPNGVPENLAGLTTVFKYNDRGSFDIAVSDPKVGVVIMEVQRNIIPDRNFLEHIRSVTSQKGIVLIFDECTSGFRETYAGVHLKYEIYPDIVMYGKALGNGHAITALVGRRSIMEAAQSSFISSTFWTEKVGYAAAIKTLEVMQREKAWVKVTNIGKKLKKFWYDIARRNNVNINVFGLDAIPSFTFNKYHLESKTYVSQQMLKKGFLATNVVFCSTAHSDQILNDYLSELDNVFNDLGKVDGDDFFKTHLQHAVCTDGFKRVN